MQNKKFGITYDIRKCRDNSYQLVIPDKYPLLAPDVVRLISEVQTSLAPNTTSAIPVTALQIIITMHDNKKNTHLIPLCTPCGFNCHDKYIVRGKSVYYYSQNSTSYPVRADIVKLSTIQEYTGTLTAHDLWNMSKIRRDIKENIVRKLMFTLISNNHMPATLYDNTTDFLRGMRLKDLYTAIKNCFGEEVHNLYINSFRPTFSYGVIVDTLDT